MSLRELLRRPASLSLLAVNSALLGCLLGSLAHPWHASVPQPPAFVSPDALPTAAAGATLTDQYALLIGHPVFHRDRTYTPPPKADTAVAQTPPPDFAVTGFLAIPGRPGKAFLRERSGGHSLAVAVGDGLEGWTITSVGPKQVEVRQNGRSALLVRSGPPVEGGAAPAAAAPAAASIENAPVGIAPQPSPTTDAPKNSPAPAVAAPPPTGAAVTGPALPKPRPLPREQTAEPTASLTTITVTPQKGPREFGPPMLVEPRGPLLTYMPPAQAAAR